MWSAKYWLWQGVEWADLKNEPFDIVQYPLLFTIPMLCFRVLWEAFIGISLGHALGYNKGPVLPNIVQHLLGGFARNSRQKRVLECFWRFSFYTAAFIYGFLVLRDKSWLWDVKQCWIGYPYHSVDQSVWWYYMLETSFYYSLLMASFFDAKRSDFWQLIIHHIVTVGLLSVSWTINFVRVGTLVLISHDLSDILLEGGKLVRYDGHMKTGTNIAFVLFLISWIVTRLGFYPLVVIRSAVFEAASLIQPDYEIFNPFQIPYVPRMIILLLVALLALHVFWTFIIFRIVVRTITQGEAADVRSDDEGEVEDEEEEKRLAQRKKKLRRKAD